jgi:hypothetical protein
MFLRLIIFLPHINILNSFLFLENCFNFFLQIICCAFLYPYIVVNALIELVYVGEIVAFVYMVYYDYVFGDNYTNRNVYAYVRVRLNTNKEMFIFLIFFK